MSERATEKPKRMTLDEVSSLVRRNHEDFAGACTVRRYLQPIMEGWHGPVGSLRENVRELAKRLYQEYYREKCFHRACENPGGVAFPADEHAFDEADLLVRSLRPVPLSSVSAWIKRAIQRDGGEGAWWKLELYLPGEQRTNADTDAYFLSDLMGCDRALPLQEILSRVASPLGPDEHETSIIWWQAVEIVGGMYKYGGYSLSMACGIIVDVLATSGVILAHSRQALKVQLLTQLRRDETHMHGMWLRMPGEDDR